MYTFKKVNLWYQKLSRDGSHRYILDKKLFIVCPDTIGILSEMTMAWNLFLLKLVSVIVSLKVFLM